VLSTVEAEVSSQPASLSAFLEEPLVRAPAGSIIVGAGDSYAASHIASHLSSMRHTALDPYELASSPALALGKTVYFVSVSGRTASNIAAAKAVAGFAKETTAITANPGGGLSDATDGAIFIPYKFSPRLPGTLSFSLSLLALLKLTEGRFACDFARMYSRAERDAGRIVFSERGTTHFLGNGAAFPACLYAALKVCEIMGSAVQCSLLEEFNHSAVFALNRGDAVNIICAFDPLGLGRKLSVSLRGHGFRASAIPAFGSNPQEQIFYFVFLSQLAVLRKAESKGLSRAYFVRAPGKLSISDSLIY
jgi:fructoselysine-6-P-deglycase FrlB-like protein